MKFYIIGLYFFVLFSTNMYALENKRLSKPADHPKVVMSNGLSTPVTPMVLLDQSGSMTCPAGMVPVTACVMAPQTTRTEAKTTSTTPSTTTSTESTTTSTTTTTEPSTTSTTTVTSTTTTTQGTTTTTTTTSPLTTKPMITNKPTTSKPSNSSTLMGPSYFMSLLTAIITFMACGFQALFDGFWN